MEDIVDMNQTVIETTVCMTDTEIPTTTTTDDTTEGDLTTIVIKFHKFILSVTN